MSLPFAAPPGLPPDRAEALRSAFVAMTKDETFAAETRALGFDLSPIDGDAVRTMIARSATTSRDVIERYNAIVKN
jgi:tripartite-type tricarboxylate transporter receptor subunit TctC